MIVRDTIARLARRFDGVPYLYAANGPLAFDCSGFACFLLQVAGIIPEKQDLTADQLSRMFEETTNPQPGDLAVYGTKEKAVHIMVFFGPGKTVMGASGGDSRTTTLQAALHARARVHWVPVDYRRDFLGYRNILARAGGRE